MQDTIIAAEKRIADSEKLRVKFEQEKEFYVKRDLPPDLQQKIQKNEADIKAQRELIDAKKKEVTQVNSRYDEDKRRYVELTRGTKR